MIPAAESCLRIARVALTHALDMERSGDSVNADTFGMVAAVAIDRALNITDIDEGMR